MKQIEIKYNAKSTVEKSTQWRASGGGVRHEEAPPMGDGRWPIDGRSMVDLEVRGLRSDMLVVCL